MSRDADIALPPPALPTVAWARQLAVVIPVPLLLSPITFTLLNHPQFRSAAGITVLALLTATLIGLHSRHTLACIRGVRPRFGLWTLGALAVIVYVPIPWLGLEWATSQAALIASALMLLGPRIGAAVVAALLAMMTVVYIHGYWGLGTAARLGFDVSSAFSFHVIVGVALYATARLVPTLAELDQARTELAELAVRRERLRVSRDLHDFLGQSLTAVSLKGELAIRLVPSDPEAAHAEIRELSGVAREAAEALKAIARDELTLSLRDEIDRAVALLDSGGVQTEVRVELAGVPAAVQDVLAWAVREGVTNILRHSTATPCTITAGRSASITWLEIINDGAHLSSGSGSGLTGLSNRALAGGGQVSAQTLSGDMFSMRVEIPEEAA